jgi:hypothetical protein
MAASGSGGDLRRRGSSSSSSLSSFDFFFVILLRFDLRRGATPCGGGGTRLVGMVAGLMRLVFAMPTKAISQRSFMWYFKSDYTRLNNYMHLLWVAAQANVW